MVGLQTRLDRVVGKATATALQKAFEIQTVGHLLTHYPRRLADKGELTSFAGLALGEHVTVLAKVVDLTEHPYFPKTGKRGRPAVRTQVTVTDGDQTLSLTFFRQPWLKKYLHPGTVGFFSGRVRVFRRRRELEHPTYEVLGKGADLEAFEDEEIQRWWPIYPATQRVSSKKIMRTVEQVLEVLDDPADPLPYDVRREHGLPTYAEALRRIHQPDDPPDWERARQRLRFDEAFVLQTVLAQRRHEARTLPATARPGRADGLLARFDAALPFTLTDGQQRVGAEVADHLAEPHPMHVLLQGEVGSGKTVVALRAMLQVVDAGGQAALLAPTEVLAVQHHRTLTELLGPLGEGGRLGGAEDGTRVALLTGSLPARARRTALLEMASGEAGLVVGTHALLQEGVQFADLGLVVVDEQHRFGVEQRAALTSGAADAVPHLLVMTATPIPRTVAMTVFGDLEVATLRELPQGRLPVQTTVVPLAEHPAWQDRVWERVREEVEKGHQVYVVCPRIGDDGNEGNGGTDGDADTDQAGIGPPEDDGGRRTPLAAAVEVSERLRSEILPGLRIGMLHSRMSNDDREEVMRRFDSGVLSVLVATTVIEVGVDVPNATTMVVLDADRFGVSQLHQLRGRVGRGSAGGLCLLVTEAPADSPSRERLDGVAATTDGFELARLDLRSRREGDVLGAQQSGRRSSLKLLSVLRDAEVIADARRTAERVVRSDPTLENHPTLAAAVADVVESERGQFLERS